ncbi:hypothetical protein A5661_15780 [Mycobacterium asiaticum]|nr:hypothetical protein A5661_15780 [Mycobacterium asiaticum]
MAAPLLPGAACVGRPEMFAEAPPGEPPAKTRARTEAAITVCTGCPEIGPCAAWLDSLPESHRPVGVVVAGHIVRRRKKTHPKGTT